MKNLIGINLFILSLILFQNLLAQSPTFDDPVKMGLLEHDSISEASGLAASRKNLNVLWTHNDSGNENHIFALDVYGKHLGTFQIGSHTARDWEDIAIGSGPEEGMDYIHIGDIGDNSKNHSLNYIYRFVEPAVNSSQSPKDSLITDDKIDVIIFNYPDGPQDAEALMVDPINKDIYIISKQESQANVFLARYPQPISEIITVEFVAELDLPYLVAADISGSGEEILVKTYTNIFYWQRNTADKLWHSFSTAPDLLPYAIEPQGESVCWAGDDSGYFTLSEEPFNIQAYLYFYPRSKNTSIKRAKNIPGSFFLKQNHPNPFNQSTTISYRLNKPGTIQILIYDDLGRLVNSLKKEANTDGEFTEIWDGRDRNGNISPSGIYFYGLKTDDAVSQLKSMVLLK